MKTIQIVGFAIFLSLVKSQSGRQRQVHEFFHGDEERETNFINNRRFIQAPPPVVKIMKQMTEVHEDGSYTFGFESQDGTYRIETRSPDGMTKGKYGYRDERGDLHEIDYTAGGAAGGYEPRGRGIIVPPRAPPPQLKERPIYEQRRRFDDRFDDESIPIRREPPPQRRPISRRVDDDEPAFFRPQQPTRRNVNPMIEYISNLRPWSKS